MTAEAGAPDGRTGMALRPTGQWRHPAVNGRNQHLILICQEGSQSSLAAATLQRLGLVNATDMDGGFSAWAAAGLPVIAQPTTGQDHPVTVTVTAGRPGRVGRGPPAGSG
jgi:rhodanese-related sulfurtransferase